MKILKNVLALFLCTVLIFCLAPGTAAENEGDGVTESVEAAEISDEYTYICESDSIALYVNTGDANIAVADKRTGKVWTAFPEGTSSQSELSSMLNVTYNGGTDITMQVGTHNAAVGFDILKITDGIKEIFYFETEALSFEIPFKLVLCDDYVDITLLYKEIKEEGEGRISDIKLLPNWALGKSDEDGYVFIPDGSGAVIEYKDTVSRTESYSAMVYGDDPSQDLIYSVTDDSETVRMPVFGVKQGNNAVFSVITEGDTYATVCADVSGGNVGVCASFIYRESDLTGIQENGGATRTMTILQSKPLETEPCIRQYYLSGDDANYSGMANTYRTYLEKGGVLTEKAEKPTSAVAIEAFGAVSEERSFLGVKYDYILPVTDFDTLTDISKRLAESGVENTQWYLYGFLKGGYEGGTTAKPSYLSKLGGEKGYKKFAAAAGTENVFTVYNISRSFGDSFAFFRTNQYMKSLNQTTVEQHYRVLANQKWNTDFGSWRYYTVAKQKKLFLKLLKKLPGGSGIVLEHTGDELVSDFSTKNSVSRGEYMRFINQMLEKCESKGVSTAFESGNAYAAKYAAGMYEIPIQSSGFTVESCSVPFYTMVYHGYIPLASNAVNDAPDRKTYMLKCFEQGVSALWRVTGIDPHEIKDTKLNFLYNSETEDIFETAVSMAEDYNDVHSVLFDKRIVSHKYEKGLSITEYENGWQIVCNYGDTVASYEGTEVIPAEYAVIRQIYK